MSVIGIDFGNESCYVAAAKAGGIETLANDYSLRATPSCVAFAGKKRILGVAAKNQQVTNMKNTISGFKRLLGRKYYDPQVEHELSTIPNKTEKLADGNVGYSVNYLDGDHEFTAVQLTAMLFTKLKETSVNALQAQVNDCVITCPIYFTNLERKALLDAATIAGLNVLRLMNETTATALSYGFYKQDLPEERPRIVIFVDCGHASLQVSACGFTKGKLKMLASTWDQIGGRDFDLVLADYFAKNFQDKYKIDAKSNPRAWLRLLAEVEKIKKQMSANSTKLPLNIECFMNEIDVSSTCQRSIMEDLCQHLFKRIDNTLRKCLVESRLHLDEIHSVEVVGGTSRIPAIKALIEQVFGKPASTTLNQDESVARGAALQCAIISPAVRVREFGVTDIQPYAVKVLWDTDSAIHSGHSVHSGEMEVFPLFHSAPFSRVLTLFRREPFRMQVMYEGNVSHPERSIGDWRIPDIRPTEKGEPQEVKVKIRINHHGIVLISSASLIEKKEIDEVSPDSEKESTESTQPQAGEAMDVSHEACNDNDEEFDGTNKYGSSDSPTASSPGGQGWAQRVKGWFTSGTTDKKKKPSKATIELPLEIVSHGGYNPVDINILVNQEAKMIANDEKEKQRVDARNALEEYVYDMRDKLQDGGALIRFVTDSDRASICSLLNDLENWLYEDGEDCDGETYKEKLSNLHTQTDPIKNRHQEYESYPQSFEQLSSAVQIATKAVIEYRRGSSKYDHLTETDILNVSEAAEKAKKWLDDVLTKISRSPTYASLPVRNSEIRHEYQVLNSLINSVINRPKPKPPASSSTKTSDQTQSQNGDANNTDKNDLDDSKSNSHHIPDDSTMDVE